MTAKGKPTKATTATKPIDWQEWHSAYEDPESDLTKRLELVRGQITNVLDSFTGSPLRVVSMCAGEGRDLLGALERHARRDVVGRLVELDPELAKRASAHAAALGLKDLEVVVGDAGATTVYDGAVPADLILVCGVFGNISDADIEKTLRALPMFSNHGATALWTRHRREPDMTMLIREWLSDSGFENTAYEPVTKSRTLGTVGAAVYRGETKPLKDDHLFTFIRETL